MMPLPDGESFASPTASFRSAMNWSTTGTVKRYVGMCTRRGQVIRQNLNGHTGHTVTAMCTAAGLVMAFRCQPRLPILSPTSSTFSVEPFAAANATTDAGGFPSTRSSVISVRIRCAMVFAAVTIDLHDSR